jgi:transposase
MAVDGVGPLIATALIAAVGDARQFHSGRDLSAWLGLVPRQHSSGGRSVLLGISKRGDRYLQGASRVLVALRHSSYAIMY